MSSFGEDDAMPGDSAAPQGSIPAIGKTNHFWEVPFSSLTAKGQPNNFFKADI